LQDLSEDLNYELELREAPHWMAAEGKMHQQMDSSPMDSPWKDVAYDIKKHIQWRGKGKIMFCHITIRTGSIKPHK
jgi:hypothetical protein